MASAAAVTLIGLRLSLGERSGPDAFGGGSLGGGWVVGGRPAKDMGVDNDKLALSAIFAVSALIFGSLIWLIYFHQSGQAPAGSAALYRMLPACNALFNALSAVCLVSGYRAVRRRDIRVHRRFMLSALAFSALFLTGYVIYHSALGDTKFLGTGAIRVLYFSILVSHIVLTMACLPAILLTVFFALGSRFDRHRRIARYTLPMWLYVSVTGVMIFGLLRLYG